MAEYSIFQENFDPVLYLKRPLILSEGFDFNKQRIIEHGSQIPSKFYNNFTEEHENIDHGYLNLLNDYDDKEYIYKNDYLELIKFLNREDILENGTKYGGPKVSYYVFKIIKNNVDNLDTSLDDEYNSAFDDYIFDYVNDAIKYKNKYILKLLVDSFDLKDLMVEMFFDSLSNYKEVKFLLNAVNCESYVKTALENIEYVWYDDFFKNKKKEMPKHLKTLGLLIDYYNEKNPREIALTYHKWIFFVYGPKSLEFYLSHTNTPFRANAKYPYEIPDESLSEVVVYFNPELESIFVSVYGKKPKGPNCDYLEGDVY